ncbi:4-hydroxythreonine-4-phosphate dehydrogenase PdxA [Thermosediminibacter oceani]|uniref:4-hydroxythreonine-4-phosphate dehydrogenase n=1 Tax=Thermosediminibacter oceani (strain ATCC BAA-1034 / DSM 16646 / JW/IW-1228P) TaxID=555079 RepID=D9S1Z9_THEOJ|nr:4-hydroxythreonine-4-phosphate dehydrogenase PdxA [Thermosediminibacter oceani]ADL07426.1 4-hydroxythreonine-4-phosphate dehydrogenase [Thermosediminibacter oceani DSM 16646]
MRPLVAITMGDPAGVGPEISLKAAASVDVSGVARPLILGSGPVLRYYADLLKLSVPLRSINSPEDYLDGFVNYIPVNNLSLTDFEVGKVSSLCGRAAYEYLEAGVKMALRGEVSAIATAPLNKEALHRAGLEFAGHTEILAKLTGTKDYAMMLVAGNLRVIHVSTHVAIRKACDLVKEERVYKTVTMAAAAAGSLGIRDPRIAIAGLNPHAGEKGLFGDEEIKEIVPAVEKAREQGFDVYGPLSPDTVFLKASRGEYDVVVAMYHDQGHIAVKMAGFEKGVNITVGLPIIRTSVDHGTAFDIAGNGIADERSMVEAVKLAAQMAKK